MLPIELAVVVGRICDAVGVPYFVTGGVASTYYGEARSTLDLDVVVELASKDFVPFCQQFQPPEWELDLYTARRCMDAGMMFNIGHSPSGLKVDVVALADTPFAGFCMKRARHVDLLRGEHARFATPEDVILNKLLFYMQGGSEKHIRDITGILRVSGGEVDFRHLEDWALRIGVSEQWHMVKKKVGLP